MSFAPTSFPPLVGSATTVNVLIDILQPLEIVHVPDNRKRRIAWLSPYLVDTISTPPANDNFVCYIVDQTNADVALESHPHALGLIILEPNEPFRLRDETVFPQLAKRLVVVRRADDSPVRQELLNQINISLFNLYRWYERCENIVRTSGNVQELIDCSSELFGNWINVTDATFNLVAHTRNIEPPDLLSQNLVALGCHSALQLDAAKSAGMFGEWRDQSGIQTFGATEEVPFMHATYVMRLGRSYRGHVVIVFNNNPLTPGMVDLFETLSTECEKILVGTRAGATGQAPFEGFLMHLLDNPSPSQDYVENQKATIGIDGMGAYCTVIIDSTDGAYSEQPMFLLAQARSTLTNSLVMPHKGALLVLFYAPHLQSRVILKMAKELDRFCERFDCLAFESMIYDSIENFGHSYQQALASRKYRYDIENSVLCKPADSHRERVFYFADAFCCMVYDAERIADPLISYSLAHSQLDLIEQLQADNEVSDLKVLYYFLYNERKATPTAEQLGMHRNNVLYRIRAIEKRYQFNLDRFSTRQYLLACFRMKLNSSPQFRKLLM